MTNFKNFKELSDYYNWVSKEIEKIESIFEEERKSLSKYYRNVRTEGLKELIELEKSSREAKNWSAALHYQEQIDYESGRLIGYKNIMLKIWEHHNCGDEELYCYLKYLENEQEQLAPLIAKGARRFNKDITESISKGYIFERIIDSTELLSYFEGLQKTKEEIEQEISDTKKIIDISEPEGYRKHLQKEYLESEAYFNLIEKLFSVESETRELSKIVDMIKKFKENAATESCDKTIVETGLYDQTITDIADCIYKKYRNVMIRRYVDKQSTEAYRWIYNQEIEANAMACETMQRVLE